MIYKQFHDKKLSALGMGCMRLPTDGDTIDYNHAQKIVDYAMAQGVNYFDTAYMYHSGESQYFLGKALQKYPRESYFLTNKLPIKIFLINNSGYHSIRITQSNLFSHHCKVGIGVESGDLSFPEFKKIAQAFGYPYYSASSNAEMKAVVDEVLAQDGPVFCEIFTDTVQVWEPKSSTKRLHQSLPRSEGTRVPTMLSICWLSRCTLPLA